MDAYHGDGSDCAPSEACVCVSTRVSQLRDQNQNQNQLGGTLARTVDTVAAHLESKSVANKRSLESEWTIFFSP